MNTAIAEHFPHIGKGKPELRCSFTVVMGYLSNFHVKDNLLLRAPITLVQRAIAQPSIP